VRLPGKAATRGGRGSLIIIETTVPSIEVYHVDVGMEIDKTGYTMRFLVTLI
jgi:hypothetical protein